MNTKSRCRRISLIEVTVMLIVMALLSGALAPTVMKRVRRARVDRARGDVCAIRDALLMFLSEVSAPGVSQDPTLPIGQQLPVELLVTDGDIPELGPDGGAEWVRQVDLAEVDFLEYHLITNNPGADTSRKYSGWKGAYMTAPLDPDPWGNHYMVNVLYLWRGYRGSDSGGGGGGGDTRTQGYWKNHPDTWPTDDICIGSTSYSVDQAIGLMKTPVAGDMTYAMFYQLVAAKLNVAKGCDSSCIRSTITSADTWMSTYGPVGGGVPGGSLAWRTGENLKNTLDAYNNGRMCGGGGGGGQVQHGDRVRVRCGYPYDVVVISAGPDEEIDSKFTLDGFVPGDDDIICLVSRGTLEEMWINPGHGQGQGHSQGHGLGHDKANGQGHIKHGEGGDDDDDE